MRIVNLILGATVLVLSLASGASAQRMALSRASGASGGSGSHGRAARFASARGQHGAGSRQSPPLAPYASLAFPFFGDFFNPDDIYASGYPIASELPPYVLQAAREMASSHANGAPFEAGGNLREPASSQPLMIELQNGRYVHVDAVPADGDAREIHSAPQKKAATVKPGANAIMVASSALPATLPPVTLLFRDGHSEEVRDYTIADGVLYARGDYYTDGYWTKKIALSALDVSGTLAENAQHDVKFVLPSSANEVITRP
jgi:hypothetical protein